MSRINMNNVAREVCKREGGKVNLPIAQVKEVIRCFLDVIANFELYDVVMMLNRDGGYMSLGTRTEKARFKKFLDDNSIF